LQQDLLEHQAGGLLLELVLLNSSPDRFETLLLAQALSVDLSQAQTKGVQFRSGSTQRCLGQVTASARGFQRFLRFIRAQTDESLMLSFYVLKSSLKLRCATGSLFLSARRTGAGFPKLKSGLLISVLKSFQSGFDLA
jgi:hypothetical protein